MTSIERSLHFADQFLISCGTVTLDVPRRKLLLIRQRTSSEYFFPKGRKDIGERIEDAATRETFEETGVSVKLLPSRFETGATTPSTSPEMRRDLVTEPFAVVTRRNNLGFLRIIFWFIAAGDSTAVPQQGTQQEDEDFDTVWVDFEKAGSIVTFDEDREIIKRILGTL